MEKYLNVSNSKTAAIYLLIMVSLLISGCTAVGRVISVENRIMFSDTQSDQGTYSYGGLTVEYRYKLTGGNMTLDGKSHYRGGVDSLDVRLLFLDAEGRVLQQKIVFHLGRKTLMIFHHRFLGLLSKS